MSGGVRTLKEQLENVAKFNSNLDSESDFISDTQINKIIQEMYAYDKDTDNFSGFSFSEIQNQSNLQIYG